MAFGPSRRKWQNRIKPVQGLNGTFLIHAENRGMGGRSQIESNNVRRLLLEFGVVTFHVMTPPMRLKSCARPNPRHSRMVDSHLRGQLQLSTKSNHRQAYDAVSNR